MSGQTDAPRSVVSVVDCTAFYVSCERLFDAALRKKPVAVLSNGDGCVVARSQEVKDLGVKMGAPLFQCHGVLRGAGAAIRSSNYALYGDLSRRVMQTLSACAEEVEEYSIDEAFLKLPHLDGDGLTEMAHEIKERVYAWTGIPVHVGIGETKTLAKVADELSKQHGGVLSLVDHPGRDELLASVAVGDVWGIGRAYAVKLHAHGVTTALALSQVPAPWARRHMTVVGERLVRELQGVPCLPLDLVQPSRKAIARTRSFGVAVVDVATMQRAVATYASRAAEKARRHGLVAARLQVFMTTRHFGVGPHRDAALSCALPYPTNDTFALASAARELAARMWKPGYRYKKAGVVLLDLRPEEPEQAHLFHAPDPRRRALMAALDSVNGRYGAGTLALASSAAAMAPGRDAQREAWQMQQARRSPRYTTEWAELFVVR